MTSVTKKINNIYTKMLCKDEMSKRCARELYSSPPPALESVMPAPIRNAITYPPPSSTTTTFPEEEDTDIKCSKCIPGKYGCSKCYPDCPSPSSSPPPDCLGTPSLSPTHSPPPPALKKIPLVNDIQEENDEEKLCCGGCKRLYEYDCAEECNGTSISRKIEE